MEGSVSNVQFTERKRGFDPDEVANYLRQIDSKIAGLRAMATEAVERAELAEERARQAERRLGSPENDAATAASVLAMAQRTAESAVSEARAEAEALRADARRDAEQARLSAEAQSQQMVADVRRELETSRAEHLEALRQEIAELTAVRDAVATDVETFERHLATQRDRVAEAATTLARLVEDPQSLGDLTPPDVSGAEAPPADEPGPEIPHLAVAADAASLDDDAGLTLIDPEPSDTAGDAGDAGDAGVGSVGGDPDADPDAAVAEVEAWDPVTSWEPAPEPWSGEERADDAPASDEAPAWLEEPAPTSAVTGLFDDEAPTDGPPSYNDGYGLFDDETDPEPSNGTPRAGSVPFDGPSDDDAPYDDSSLGPVADEEDEAMRAFFEQDDEDDDNRRWGFRRR
jgi:DivIVA domain-containing protein